MSPAKSKAAPVVIDINVAQLLKSPMGATRAYDLNEDLTGLDPSLDPTAPLSAHVKLTRTSQGILLSLTGETSVRVPCSRCLDPTVVRLPLAFEDEFLQTADIVTGAALSPSRDDPAVLIDQRHELHLANVLREYVLVAQPMQALCKEDCRGLCLACGHNLNHGSCGHTKPTTDERWSTLKALLDK